jgi:hypothetical protein
MATSPDKVSRFHRDAVPAHALRAGPVWEMSSLQQLCHTTLEGLSHLGACSDGVAR